MENDNSELVKEMIDGMTETARQALANDELFTLGAKVQKKTLVALMKEGFTRKEAISIMSGAAKSNIK